MILLEAFRTDILDVFVLNHMHPNCPLLKFNVVLILLFIPLGEMLPKTNSFRKDRSHEVSDTESDRGPSPSPRERGHC